MSNMMQGNGYTVLIAYHANCIDGFTSAWACHKGLVETRFIDPDNITLLPVEYGKLEVLQDLAPDFDFLYVVDFSLPLLLLAALENRVAITVFDHHKTAMAIYEQAPGNIYGAEVLFDMSRCGAAITWGHFFPDLPVPRLVKYVQDYDLWQFTLADTQAINKWLRVQPKIISVWEEIYDNLQTIPGMLAAVREGLAILKYHKQIVEDLAEQAIPIELAGETGLVVNCSPHFASDVGHLLCKQSGTFGATWQQVGNDAKFSLRSEGDYDVSAIAQKFGGGGHRNAAGFTLTEPNNAGSIFNDSQKVGMKVWTEGTEVDNE